MFKVRRSIQRGKCPAVALCMPLGPPEQVVGGPRWVWELPEADVVWGMEGEALQR